MLVWVSLVYLNWNSLGFLNLDVCVLLQVRRVFRHYFFKKVLSLSLFSFWEPYDVNISPFDIVL